MADEQNPNKSSKISRATKAAASKARTPGQQNQDPGQGQQGQNPSQKPGQQSQNRDASTQAGQSR